MSGEKLGVSVLQTEQIKKKYGGTDSIKGVVLKMACKT